MYDEMIPKINEDLKRTKKAIVAIGCSFVQGQGAIDDLLFDLYPWEYTGQGHPLQIKITSKQKKQILKSFPSVRNSVGNSLDFTFMEYKNAFVNVLCEKYLKKEYTPINLGLRGCGNRGSIKELYFNHIDWNLAQEIIVIYMPSGLERFDFIKDDYTDHFRWVCMWPHYENTEETSARRSLWEGYARALNSEKFQILEQIGHVQELLTWIENKNAKLVITPGFDRRYDRDYFKAMLEETILRKDQEIVDNKSFFSNKHSDVKFLDLFPWENVFNPLGHKTFADLAMSQEPNLENKQDFYLQFLGNRSENGWMTSCAHPGQKAHDLYARLLEKHLKEKNFIREVNLSE